MASEMWSKVSTKRQRHEQDDQNVKTYNQKVINYRDVMR